MGGWRFLHVVLPPGAMSLAMSDVPSLADAIRTHLSQVASLRNQAQTTGLSGAIEAVKQLQAARFRGSYQDMLADPCRAGAARFFLDELYGSHDFSERDLQFSRIAGAIERLFPTEVGQLAADLAALHALTESLDLTMAAHWQSLQPCNPNTGYLRAWRMTGQPDRRAQQLRSVVHLGDALTGLTRKKSLRMALRMMRGPAEMAGLGKLQRFLEQGFDAFAQLDDPAAFMNAIKQREQSWLDLLNDADEGKAVAQLAHTVCLVEQRA